MTSLASNATLINEINPSLFITKKNLLFLTEKTRPHLGQIMAPPGYSWDMELLARLFRDSGIVKIKSPKDRKEK
jgi:hypothetical protein